MSSKFDWWNPGNFEKPKKAALLSILRVKKKRLSEASWDF